MNDEIITDNSDVNLEVATLGAGCFWCVEAIFSSIKGVITVQSGYCGGKKEDANYQKVCSGETEHVEVLQITFDKTLIRYDELLGIFFHSHNPTTLNRQGNDVGTQYRSVIFTHSQAQETAALSAITALTQQGVWSEPIVTQVEKVTDFYPAEDYHNDYFARHGEAPYCAMVIKPKVEKMQKAFAEHLKTN